MNTKRVRTVLFILVLLAAFLVAPFASAQEPAIAYVYPFIDGNQITIQSTEDVHIIWAWFAATPGSTREFVKGTDHSLTLYQSGVEVWSMNAKEVDSIYSDIQVFSDEEAYADCPMKRIYQIWWEYDLGMLDPGEYELVLDEVFYHPINDQLHVCLDLIPEEPVPFSPPPSLYPPGTRSYTTTLVVSAQE